MRRTERRGYRLAKAVELLVSCCCVDGPSTVALPFAILDGVIPIGQPAARASKAIAPRSVAFKPGGEWLGCSLDEEVG